MMKIVTWNCAGAFRKKFHLLEKFDADIYFIQECEDPSTSIPAYRDWANNYFWIKDTKHKGLGVFAKSHIKLERLEWDDADLKLFLPVRVNDSFNLLAVWTKPNASSNYRYIGQLWKYLELHRTRMIGCLSVLCGDLNSNKIWDHQHSHASHSDVVNQLSEVGMHSLYHSTFGEEQGKEQQKTFFMYRKQDPKCQFHIDYAFLSSDLIDPASDSISIGTFGEWIQHSDHVPLEFRVDVVGADVHTVVGGSSEGK